MKLQQMTSFVNSLLSFSWRLPTLLQNPTLPISIRTATKRAGGFKAGSSDSAGKRRGVKKGGGIILTEFTEKLGEWVRPGNIILRQVGTQWHPGENVSHSFGNSLRAGAYGTRFYNRSIRAWLGPILQESIR